MFKEEEKGNIRINQERTNEVFVIYEAARLSGDVGGVSAAFVVTFNVELAAL